MAFEKKDMTGALFTNKHREKDTHPVVKGYVVVDGVEYEVAGWSKVTRDGGKMLSLKVEAKDQPKQPADPQEPPRNAQGEPDIPEGGDIPF